MRDVYVRAQFDTVVKVEENTHMYLQVVSDEYAQIDQGTRVTRLCLKEILPHQEHTNHKTSHARMQRPVSGLTMRGCIASNGISLSYKKGGSAGYHGHMTKIRTRGLTNYASGSQCTDDGIGHWRVGHEKKKTCMDKRKSNRQHTISEHREYISNIMKIRHIALLPTSQPTKAINYSNLLHMV